jgi:hypothetical protein
MAKLPRESSSRGPFEERSAGEWAAEPAATLEASGEPRLFDRIGSSTMVVGLLAVVAVAGLYSMRGIGSLSAATALPREVEQLVASVLGARDGAAKDARPTNGPDDRFVFTLLDGDLRLQLQLPAEQLGRNPFQPWRDPILATSQPVAVLPDQRASASEAWGREIDRVAGLLQLRSTIGGGTPNAIANVNGRIVRVGDLFAVESAEAEFRVRSIERETVELEARHPRLGVERRATLRVPRPF